MAPMLGPHLQLFSFLASPVRAIDLRRSLPGLFSLAFPFPLPAASTTSPTSFWISFRVRSPRSCARRFKISNTSAPARCNARCTSSSSSLVTFRHCGPAATNTPPRSSQPSTFRNISAHNTRIAFLRLSARAASSFTFLSTQ